MKLFLPLRSGSMIRQPATTLYYRISQTRTYYSEHHPQGPPFPAVQENILCAAMCHVPSYGFSSRALVEGARECGYPEVSIQLFPGGVIQLIKYHLISQRLALKDKVQFPDQSKLGVSQRVKTLTLQRLWANKAIIHQWQGALAQMSAPGNLPSALRELQALSDEIWYLAGDTTVDTSWYTKRASLAALYASSELFMTTDTSPEFAATEEFLDRRLKNIQRVGSAIGGLGQYVGFWAANGLNLVRSWGGRI